MGNSQSTDNKFPYPQSEDAAQDSLVRANRKSRASFAMFKKMESVTSLRHRGHLALDGTREIPNSSPEFSRRSPTTPEATQPPSRDRALLGSFQASDHDYAEFTGGPYRQNNPDLNQQAHFDPPTSSRYSSTPPPPPPPPSPPPPPPHKQGIASLTLELPNPSPIPSDSPHKYGLRDFSSNQNLKHSKQRRPSPNLEIQKYRRRSTGAEIFHEAKNFQLSNSNMICTDEGERADSTSRSAQRKAPSLLTAHHTRTNSSEQTITDVSNRTSATTALGVTSTQPSRSQSLSQPSTSRSSSPSPVQPVSAIHRERNRRIKPSRFAYAFPPTSTQINCYRGHGQLHISKNKYAPVECAVCHSDVDLDHFSCSWCALRMCGYCRADLRERGLRGLKERMKMTQMEDEVGYGKGWE